MGSRDFDKYTQDYKGSPFLIENTKYRRRAVLEQIKKFNHRNVLEIGCGFFPIVQYINSDDYDNWVVFEPSREFCDNLLNICDSKNLGNKVTVICSEFESSNSNVLSKEYDFILCSSLLHEVRSAELLLNAIHGVCSERTTVHINVPNARSLHRLIALSTGIITDIHELSERNDILQQRVVYDIEMLEREIVNAGFKIVDKGSYFIKPFTHMQMQKMLDYQVIDDRVLDGLFKLTDYFPDFGSEIFINFSIK